MKNTILECRKIESILYLLTVRKEKNLQEDAACILLLDRPQSVGDQA
jgi:hypothetical protein